jgi:hypothetical protein
VLEFVVDQLYLIAVAVFAGASFVIIRRSRRGGHASSGTPGVAGLRTAAIASIMPVLILALLVMALGWLLRGLFWDSYPGSAPPPVVDPVKQVADNLIALLTLVAIPGVTFLAVLDLYAVRPPRPEHRSGDAKSFAVLGTLFSLVLFGGTLLVSTMIVEAVDAAARRDAEAAASAQTDAEAAAREARSAGLSIEVTVADVEVGPQTEQGRVLTRLTLDVTVRSATAIDLSQAKRGVEAGLLLYNGNAADVRAGLALPYYGEITEGMGLPAHIPAGFETTYRLDVPTAWSCPKGSHVLVAEECEAPDYGGGPDFNPPVPGPWQATFVFSNDFQFDDPRYLDYTTRTDFTVGEVP